MHRWNLTSLPHHTDDLFQDQLHDMMGHKFRVVALRHFPFMDYQPVSDEPGGPIIPKDCLDTRFITTFAAKLNFTYEMHEQREKQWGVPTDGKFNGMMGELQREETDFCMIAAPTPERLQVTEYSRGYPSTELIIVSLKPTVLPEYLALIRPFAGDLWFALLGSVVAWALLLWVLERAWRWVARGSGVKFNTALLYGWGALLEQPPRDLSVSVSGQILPVDEALSNVKKGGFSFLTFREYVSIIIASRYTDSLGNTPFYVSKTSVSMMAAFGWGTRKGAPFYPRFSQLMSLLEDAGITAYWKADVRVRRVRENRAAAALDTQANQMYTQQVDRRQVVLGLGQLQGAFYLLFLGCGISFLTLLRENLVHSHSPPQ
ncbi:Glutamate receptor ionotropic, NMDA 1-like 5 [Homarus americanus]|uniref:Glutamate receptor ionotropic, NMDA 1-like 5 n=1 Tax=Homarus americanus TaxID=6706 RepID=A0A8J5JVC2_HOMAM|nr:Glutamate receptor ionotropic, NMDA 1-like 5 [Homarus americanus]